jgi:DNA-binding NarL/FixJ family response regulator
LRGDTGFVRTDPLQEVRMPVRVVVADDADGVRELTCLLLEMDGDFQVVGRARDGAEAIDVSRSTRPDLVLLDVAMPVMDGIAALPHLRSDLPTARLVLFTGFRESSLEREARAAGADAVIEKGVGVQTLVQTLREICLQPRSSAVAH